MRRAFLFKPFITRFNGCNPLVEPRNLTYEEDLALTHSRFHFGDSN
jgi:hypothetical protein